MTSEFISDKELQVEIEKVKKSGFFGDGRKRRGVADMNMNKSLEERCADAFIKSSDNHGRQSQVAPGYAMDPLVKAGIQRILTVDARFANEHDYVNHAVIVLLGYHHEKMGDEEYLRHLKMQMEQSKSDLRVKQLLWKGEKVKGYISNLTQLIGLEAWDSAFFTYNEIKTYISESQGEEHPFLSQFEKVLSNAEQDFSRAESRGWIRPTVEETEVEDQQMEGELNQILGFQFDPTFDANKLETIGEWE